MTENKNILLLFDGPAGAGKTTLLNIIIKWENFELMRVVSTRKKRPSDGEEMKCVSSSEFHTQKSNNKIICPQIYEGNNKWYGIKKKSLEQLQKANMVGVIYPDWQMIDELRNEYNVIAIFLSVKEDILKERLLKRADSKKQKNQSIDYLPVFLKNYKKNKHRFDYHLENNTTLDSLEGRVKEILRNHKI